MLNPVFRRELITALRSRRTYLAICVYVLALLGVAVFMMYSAMRVDFIGGFDPQSAINTFNFISSVQLGLIILIVPAITAGQINGERERQTLDLMLVSKMSPLAIVIGKLLSSLMLVLLIIIASIPVFAVFAYFGIVSVANLAALTLFMLVIAMMTGSMSILCSTIFKRTMVAYVISYFVMLALLVGSAAVVRAIFHVFWTTHFNTMELGGMFVPFTLSLQWREIFTWLLALNPLVGFMSLNDAQSGTASLNTFLTQWLFRWHDVRLTLGMPLWVVNVLINTVFSFGFIGLAAWLLRPVKRFKKQ